MRRYPVAVDTSTTPTEQQTRSHRSANRRTFGLTIVLFLLSGVMLAQLDLGLEPSHGGVLTGWMIALLFLAFEADAIEFEFRRERHVFGFGEVVTVLGMFLATPAHLITGTIVSAVVLNVVILRLPIRKAAFNIAVRALEVAVALEAFALLADAANSDSPRSWGAALIAVAAGTSAASVAVTLVVRWNSGSSSFPRMLAVSVVFASINTTFALAATILVTVNPWAVMLLVGIGAFLILSYRVHTALSKRYQSLSMLYDFTKIVSAARHPDAVLGAMLSHAKDLLHADRAQVWLISADNDPLRISVDDSGWSTSALSVVEARLVLRWFGTDPSTRLVSKDARGVIDRQIAEALGATDCIVAPVTEAGEIVGLVAVLDRLGGTTFETADGRMFATLANHASVALENGRLLDRIHEQTRQQEHDALHDALTGLPNRVLFGERLRETVGMMGALHTTPAVAIMDLDGFKEINDTLGHQSGDIVLTEIGQRIATVVDPTVLVARLGGDEFAFLMTSADRGTVAEQAQRIVDVVGRPLQIHGLSVNMGISIGIAMAPHDGDDAATLMQRADVAMYVAKSNSENISFYVADHDANTPRRLTLAHDLRHAIEDGQFHLVYQPKAHLDDGTVIGTEALARWVHPVLGPISPDEFIPLAERIGVMAQLTEWALATALAQIPVWDSHGLDWGVSVNLSMRNLIDAELVPTVRRLLEESGVDPGRLTLEITETNVMADAERTISILNTFGDMGIHLSVDDFGTGYSSLSYLQRLPIDEVKIDKFFVLAMATDQNAEAIVRSILDLARHLRLKVVAEGVEDQQAWDRLRDLGCTIAQGYFLARPMPAADLEHWARVQNETLSSAPLRLVRSAS